MRVLPSSPTTKAYHVGDGSHQSRFDFSDSSIREPTHVAQNMPELVALAHLLKDVTRSAPTLVCRVCACVCMCWHAACCSRGYRGSSTKQVPGSAPIIDILARDIPRNGQSSFQWTKETMSDRDMADMAASWPSAKANYVSLVFLSEQEQEVM